MSLHILRHKTWHPWNKENQERFDRDEAQHRQEVEKEAKETRKLAFGNKIELLKSQLPKDEPKPYIEESNKDIQPNPEIEAFERQNGVQKEDQIVHSNSSIPTTISTSTTVIDVRPNVQYGENNEYLKEKELQYKREMKESGIANWRLNSFKREDQPWYLDTLEDKQEIKRSLNGRILTSSQYERQIRANELSKQSEDPMFEYLSQPKTSLDSKIKENQSKSYEQDPDLFYQAMNQSRDIITPEYQPKIDHSIARGNPNSENKQHRHRHRHRHSHHSHKHSESEDPEEKLQKKYDKELLIEKLRKERLEREETERKRSTNMLIEHSGISIHQHESKKKRTS